MACTDAGLIATSDLGRAFVLDFSGFERQYEDVEHSIRRNAYRIDMLDRIGSFLDTNIGQPAAAAAAP